MTRAVTALLGCYRAFRDLDATWWRSTRWWPPTDGQLLALDCKMTFDDNALFRRPNVSELRDYAEEDPRESQAAEYGINYVALDGEIGCIVNGAGLAMGTMDLIKHAGSSPANFLDVGGGASPEKVCNAFRLVLADPKVRAILVNIFAGINRCDWVAQGVVNAVRELRPTVPLVVRLAGTNVEEGRRILRESGLDLVTADTLTEAAEKVVAALKAAGTGRNRPRARPPEATESHEHPDRRTDPRHHPGLHRRQGHLPRQGDAGLRDQPRGRRHARARAASGTSTGRCSTRSRRRSSRPAPRRASSSCRPRSAPTPSWRRPTRASG